MVIDRRTFLLAAAAAAGSSAGLTAQGTRVTTLTDWMHASRPERERALAETLEHIAATDPAIHAWVQVLPQVPTGEGPLFGIPFGAKDILETAGLSTEYGSPIYKGRIGTVDAGIVRQLRQRGAVLLGKTHTTSFAYRTPAPTRNPRNLEHTPGGSSSGSAAAVAAGMVPVALGTQTMGSVLRPASYCGVTGFKPTYGVLPTDGVLTFSTTLDTLGLFTHRAADMLALWGALGYAVGSAEAFAVGVPDPLPALEPEMTAALHRAIEQVRRAGIAVRPVNLAPLLADLHDAAMTVEFYEGARAHEVRSREHGDRLEHLAVLVREGLAIPASRYDAAIGRIAAARATVSAIYKATPILLVPGATGPAPRGLALTGDARMNSPWTALGTPAITIPMPVGENLPLGLQLTAERGDDARVLQAAVRVQAVLA